MREIFSRLSMSATAILLLFTSFTTPVKSGHNTCPSDMVLATEGVCIDKFEWPNKPGRKPMLGASGLPEEYDVKVGKVMDAKRLCASVGKRVCHAKEWVAACEGQHEAKYPFGNELPDFAPGDGTGLCNYDKKFIGPDEYKVFARDPKEMRRLDQSEPAGSRKTCRSASGAYDMVGNAEEWVTCDNGRYGWCLVSRFWAEPFSCHNMIITHAPRWHYYSTGFRCCKDAE